MKGMGKMKKLAIVVVLVMFALSQNVFAADIQNPEPSPAEAQSISGVIVKETDTTIEVKSGKDDSTIVFNLEAVPYMVDCVSGQPLPLKDRKTDNVIVYYGPIVTASMPPQSTPILIICDIPADYQAPHYGRVESLERDDNSVKVTIDGGSLIVTIERDTPISPYLTRNIVTIDNIQVGSDLLLWYPLVAMSFPGQATAQKTVILGTGPATDSDIGTGTDIAVTPITPVMPVNPFSDVLGTDWFIDDVIYAHSIGLVDGKTATIFAPNDNLTYAEAVKLAACMHQLYTEEEVTLTNGDPWYQSYVDYAKTNDIISEDYEYNAQATRAGYMEIFANALPDEALKVINIIDDGTIPDVPMTDPQAAAIYKLYRAGIVQGVDDEHNCNPSSNIKRSEVAAILTRMMKDDARIEFTI
jgi:hypothetical protein